MRIFRYTFEEFGEMPSGYAPSKHKVTAENSQHARHLVKRQRGAKKNRFWEITNVEVIDLGNVPPGFVPPSWIWEGSRKRKYRDDLGHCYQLSKHSPHVYYTEAGRAKICPGDARTELQGRHISDERKAKIVEHYVRFKKMGYPNHRIAKFWEITIPELREIIDDFRNGKL